MNLSLCSNDCYSPLKLIPFLINLAVDLFAKASDGRRSGDSPCAKGLVISDADTGLIDVETESEQLCDTAAPTVTVHDLTEIKADDRSNITTDSSVDNCDIPIPESMTAIDSTETLSGSVTPAPNVVSKAPKRARASRAKSATGTGASAPAPTKRQKAMASNASASASVVVLPAVYDAQELQQGSEEVAMEVVSSSATEQPVETSSVSAAITEESSSDMCVEVEETKAEVADVGLKKRKRTATIAAKAPKKEETVLSAEVLKKIECITTRISLNLGELAALER